MRHKAERCAATLENMGLAVCSAAQHETTLKLLEAGSLLSACLSLLASCSSSSLSSSPSLQNRAAETGCLSCTMHSACLLPGSAFLASKEDSCFGAAASSAGCADQHCTKAELHASPVRFWLSSSLPSLEGFHQSCVGHPGGVLQAKQLELFCCPLVLHLTPVWHVSEYLVVVFVCFPLAAWCIVRAACAQILAIPQPTPWTPASPGLTTEELESWTFDSRTVLLAVCGHDIRRVSGGSGSALGSL